MRYASSEDVTPVIDDLSLRALAHELRTPVTSLLGYAQLLQRNGRVNDPELVRDGLGVIEHRASQLQKMLARLSAFADPSGTVERLLPRADDGLTSLLADVAASGRVSVRLSSEADRAMVDRDSLDAVMRELVENALQHGVDAGSAIITGQIDGEPPRLVMRVACEGPGVPSGAGESIFAPLTRLNHDAAELPDGLGLGLALARRIAEGAGGSLVLECPQPAIFRLALPLVDEPIAARFRAMKESSAHAEAQAVRAVKALDDSRERILDESVRDDLATAYEWQLRSLGDFRKLHRQAMELTERLDRVYLEITAALARAVEARDEYTGSHVERVSARAVEIARALGLADESLRQIEFGGVLHDVGKIGVPDAVLGKPGALNDEEWAAMRRHPEMGRRMLDGIMFLGPALDAVAYHHERWDGGGYPARLGGEEIPLAGRIVAVADAYDAMTTDRPYRPGFSAADASAEIRRSSGKAFDPDIVDAFLGTLPLAS